MCLPDPVMLAIGAGMSYMSKRANDKAIQAGVDERSSYFNRTSDQIADRQNRINYLVDNQIPDYTPENTQALLADRRDQTVDSINNAVLEANLRIDDPTAKGKTSSAYERLYAGKVLENEQKLTELAKNYATIAAPNQVGFDQSVERQKTGEQIQGIGDNINNLSNIGGNASKLVNVRPNAMAGVMGEAGKFLIGKSLGNIFEGELSGLSDYGSNGNYMPRSYSSTLMNKPSLTRSNYAFG